MYLNKLLILKKLQQANTHLGLTVGRAGSRGSRFIAQRAQSYIYGFRAAQPIIDLDKTVISLRRACNVIQLIIRSRGRLLFVNTNSKYNKIIQHTAKCTNQSFINHKWIGGFLTNWNHMQHVQQQFHAAAKFTRVLLKERSTSPIGVNDHLARTIGSSLFSSRQTRYAPSVSWGSLGFESSELGSPNDSKKGDSVNIFERPARSNASYSTLRASTVAGMLTDPKYKKMQKCFEGTIVSSTKGSFLRKLSPTAFTGVTDCVVIFNANQNSTAIYEAHVNQIPIISIVDSNIPNELYKLITYPIPANSESVQFIYLFCNCILKTILLSQ